MIEPLKRLKAKLVTKIVILGSKFDQNCYRLSKIDVYSNNYGLCIDWKLDSM